MISWFDIVMIIPLGFAAFMGFKKGFIIEITSIIALLFGIYGAIGLSGFTEGYLKTNMESNSKALPVAAFAITFIVIVVGIYFIGKLLEGVVKITALGIINRIAGVVFGLLKMGLIISGLIFLLNAMDKDRRMFGEEVSSKALLYPPLEGLAPKIFPSLKTLYNQNPVEKVVDEIKKEVKN